MRSLRLLPVVIMTSLVLLGMKGFNLVLGPQDSLTGVARAQAQEEGQETAQGDAGEAEEMAAPAEEGADGQDAAVETAQDSTEELPNINSLPVETSRDLLLERLGERRVVMDEREQDLRVREQLLEAAERRLEERMEELAALEARVSAASDAREQRESEEIARLVQVYSAMRPKDAATIFDLLDLPILMEVANAMNPRKMADILGAMTPETARQLTIALAGVPTRMVAPASAPSDDLPMIEGVPVQ